MTKTGKITTSVIGFSLLLIVVLIIVIATFDWNRLKPTINQKVSTELNRPFAIRGDLAWFGNARSRKPAGVAGFRGRMFMLKISSSATRQTFLTLPWCISRVLKLRSPHWHC